MLLDTTEIPIHYVVMKQYSEFQSLQIEVKFRFMNTNIPFYEQLIVPKVEEYTNDQLCIQLFIYLNKLLIESQNNPALHTVLKKFLSAEKRPRSLTKSITYGYKPNEPAFSRNKDNRIDEEKYPEEKTQSYRDSLTTCLIS